jgi:hypothetical protein
MKTPFALLIGIALLIPVVIHATRNLKRALKRDKELYLKSNPRKK